MGDDRLRYDLMVEGALRGVVRQALAEAASRGLPGNHHFYLTFATRDAGVILPPQLKERYPEEMTIVLQHQFYGLEVTAESFSVTLSFSNKHERLTIPLKAVTTFADPSVNFALQFQPLARAAAGRAEVTAPAPAADPEAAAPTKDKVVPLDNFRKR
jgi:hypothetical protein